MPIRNTTAIESILSWYSKAGDPGLLTLAQRKCHDVLSRKWAFGQGVKIRLSSRRRKMSDLRFRLHNNETLFGVFAKSNDPFFIEIIGKAGFDFVILDTEHGPNSPRDLYPLVLASKASGLLPVVRVAALSEAEIIHALDIGIAGIQIPHLSNVNEAMKAVELSRFWPDGSRGVCKFVRAADFSLKDPHDYFEEANRVAVIGMVEGVEGIKNFDKILEVGGIDVFFIGPYDLSQSLGVIGDIENPRVWEEVSAIVAKCKARNRAVGTFVDNFESAMRYMDLGVQFLAYSVDVGIFAEACRTINNELRRIRLESDRIPQNKDTADV